MAQIVAIKRGGRSGSHSLSQNGLQWDVEKTFTITYTVVCDSVSDTHEHILQTAGIPRVGVKMYGLICKKVSATREKLVQMNGGMRGLWTVTADFDSSIDHIDPTELPPEVSWTSEIFEEVLRKDLNGRPIQTVPGEPLILTGRKAMPVLTISRTENAPFDPSIILNYTNTINSNGFWGAPAKSALLESIQAKYKQVEMTNGDKKWFVDVTYVIKFKKIPNVSEPWKASVLHHGTKYYQNAEDEAQAWEDGRGNNGSYNLDNNGFLLADGADPVYLDFDIYEQKNFDTLKINASQIGSMFV